MTGDGPLYCIDLRAPAVAWLVRLVDVRRVVLALAAGDLEGRPTELDVAGATLATLAGRPAAPPPPAAVEEWLGTLRAMAADPHKRALLESAAGAGPPALAQAVAAASTCAPCHLDRCEECAGATTVEAGGTYWRVLCACADECHPLDLPPTYPPTPDEETTR